MFRFQVGFPYRGCSNTVQPPEGGKRIRFILNLEIEIENIKQDLVLLVIITESM